MAGVAMRVIYLTDSIGNKQNGGSGLSGLRFLQLLIGRYGQVHVVTDAVRNVPAPGEGYSVIAAATPSVVIEWFGPA